MNNTCLKLVGEAIKKVSKVAAYGLVMFGPSIVDTYCAKQRNSETVGYDDAVKAILNSSMWRSDKPEAVTCLKRCAGSNYYKAIIVIANSPDIYASDKVVLIRELSEK